MKKIILIGMLFLGLFFLSGCEKLPDDTMACGLEIATCKSPNILVGCECCPDQNNNKICDDKEFPQEKPIPGSECSIGKCIGYEYYDCVDKEGGGKHFVRQGILRNSPCEVECTQDSECNLNQKCRLNNYKCADVKDNDTICDSDKEENICNAQNDCKSDTQICCSEEVITGNCCDNSQCKEPTFICGDNHLCINQTITEVENQTNSNETA